MKRLNYKGWSNCYQLSNGCAELIVTTDIGPRLISFGFPEGENVFKEYPETLGKIGGDIWRNYGGHRLWHAPEKVNRSNLPDNSPVGIEVLGGVIRLVQSTETKSGIQKEIDIQFIKDQPALRVIHRLRNKTVWDLNLAAWAISAMSPGGLAVIPLPPRTLHENNYLPTSSIAVWSYTDLSDRRLNWGREFFSIKQDSALRLPQKLGFSLAIGWAAYWHNRLLFVKKFDLHAGKQYPDFGSMLEVFTDSDMLELESLGPLQTLSPEMTLEHAEEWWLFRDVPELRNEADIKREVQPRVDRIFEHASVGLPIDVAASSDVTKKIAH